MKGVSTLVCRKVNVLYEISVIAVGKLDGLKDEWIVCVNIEVSGDEEVVRGGGRRWKEKTRIN